MMVERLSILIPTYNNERTLPETLESLKAQGDLLERVESIHLTDDCSSDNSVNTARDCWSNEVPLQITRRARNLTQWPNVNAAFQSLLHLTEWVAILHGDDLVRQGWLDALLSRIDSCAPNVATISTGWDVLGADGTIRKAERESDHPFHLFEGGSDSVARTLVQGSWWHISGSAIRTRAFDAVGPFDPSFYYMADWEWILRCLKEGWSAELVPRNFILYRERADSVAAQSFMQDFDLREKAAIIDLYGRAINRREMTILIGRQLLFAVRRVVRGVLQVSPSRVLLSARSAFALIGTLVRRLMPATSRKDESGRYAAP